MLVILGFLAKRFPVLINPYGSLPEEKRKKVDIEGLSSFTRNCVVAMGFLLIAGFYVLKAMGGIQYLGIVVTVTLLPMSVFLLIGSHKYYK